MVQAPDYTVRLGSEDDYEGVIDLLRLCLLGFGSIPDAAALWRWKHRDNPFGSSLVVLAESSQGEIVGVSIYMRWVLRINDELFAAARPVDTATHPEFRRRGIFNRVTTLAMTQLAEEGVSLGFSTPNDQSLPGFLNLDWSRAHPGRPQLRLVGLPVTAVRLALALARRCGRDFPDTGSTTAHGMPTILAHAGLDELLQKYNSWDTTGIRTERSLAYLTWRFSGYKPRPYFVVREEEHERLKGFLVFRPYNTYGLPGIAIHEIITESPDLHLVRRLVRLALDLSQAKIAMAHFSSGMFQHRALARCGFLPDPRQGRAVISAQLGQSHAGTATGAWALSLGDMEFL